MGVFFQGLRDNISRSVADAVIVNRHAAIARAGSDLLCPVGMPIQTGLADQQFQAATKAG